MNLYYLFEIELLKQFILTLRLLQLNQDFLHLLVLIQRLLQFLNSRILKKLQVLRF